MTTLSFILLLYAGSYGATMKQKKVHKLVTIGSSNGGNKKEIYQKSVIHFGMWIFEAKIQNFAAQVNGGEESRACQSV